MELAEETEGTLTPHQKLEWKLPTTLLSVEIQHPNLGESTVRLFKKQYQTDLKKAGSEEEITQLAM